MAAVDNQPDIDTTVKTEDTSKPTLTPPASEEAYKNGDSSSELSEAEDEEDIGEIRPDHYWDGGRVPVFKPTMHEFKSFKKYIDKIDKYGMISGIVKVIPPKEWTGALPALDEAVKGIKIKNPIAQEFNGAQGKFTQANMEKQRSYDIAQWKHLTEESNHQPPAKRGERRRNQDRPTRGPAISRASRKTPAPAPVDGKKRGPGRPRVRRLPSETHASVAEEVFDVVEGGVDSLDEPPTPVSPTLKSTPSQKLYETEKEDTSTKGKGRQPKSVSSRRKHNSNDKAVDVDEEAFRDFNYHLDNLEEWTPERCHELEMAYWKSLNFNNPMYGADMPGSLFDDSTASWNVAKLENLLDVLGQKVPGVNTAYLYMGMWKATFAWHLEDVDLYSINYIHFGAPKQWYSISQEDARRFESAMKSLWPQDAKSCDQFLRHKTYLISPQVLKSQFNIEVNRLVHYEGEFVITFPYGYHSGYNLGYNCAESVNFATESWLDFGKIAKKCNCEADSVWVDVYDIERKLRGEPTPEYEEYMEEYTDDEEDEFANLPTPPGSDKGNPKPPPRKRKPDGDASALKTRVKRLRLNAPKPPSGPCVLCPHDYSQYEELLPTAEGRKAHRICALYIPETYLEGDEGSEVVHGVSTIDKKRLGLRCHYCGRDRRAIVGAAFQCADLKCHRAYHPTCAAAAGVAVEIGMQARYDENGTEYADVGIDFRCRFHRGKRPKHADVLALAEALEDNTLVRKNASGLQAGELVQFQPFKGDIYAGYVLENRKDEETLLLDLVPHRRTFEVEHKYVLPFDKANSHLVAPSANAKPLPAHLARRSQTTHEDPTNDDPKPGEPFADAQCEHKWAEFKAGPTTHNREQKQVALERPKTLWHYLGKTSTEAKAQYTGNLAISRNDTSANFLESVRPLPLPPVARPVPRQSFPATYPTAARAHAPSAPRPLLKPQQMPRQLPGPDGLKPERPYKGKYAITDADLRGGHVDPQSFRNQQAFLQSSQHAHPSFHAPPAMMRATADPKAMAEIRRRQSNPPPPLNMEHIQRMQYSRPAPQQSSSRPSSAQQQAPVANMMGSNSPAAQSTFSRSTASHPTPPSTANSSVDSRSRSDSVKALAKYPYLHAAAILRPQVYQSPYGPPGVITEPWLPIPRPAISSRSRAKSLTQNFLENATPSQREGLKGHVRTISVEKAMLQAQESERRQKEALNRFKSNMGPPQPISPSFGHGQSFTQDLFPERGFSNSPSFSDFASNAFPSNSYFNNDLSNAYPSSAYQSQPSAIQYQSPQAFQQQMQNEELNLRSKPQMMSHGRNSYGAMTKSMNSGQSMHPHAHGGQDLTLSMDGIQVGGNQGSPLRTGRGGVGGEMLPMMQDPSSF